MKQLAATVLVMCLAALPTRLWAGSASAEDNVFAPEQISQFAKSVEKYAAQKDARAFIIGRVGRPEDKLPEGIAFTHTAVAIYSTVTADNGDTLKGYAIYNLYQKEDQVERSEVVQDYPVDFFWSAKALKAGVIIPTPKMQRALIELIARGDHLPLHNPNYSAIANPFNSRYQNCTEYTLDIVNAAIYGTVDSARLKANARAHFTPTPVKESPAKILLGSVLMKDVSRDDHKGPIATTTFTSIAQYLQENHLLVEASVLKAGARQASPLLL